MAITTKVLLVDNTEEYGIGLNLIRKKESSLLDISAFDGHFDDSTLIGGIACVIKDNKVYKFVKTYFDMDNDARVFIAVLDTNESNIITS